MIFDINRATYKGSLSDEQRRAGLENSAEAYQTVLDGSAGIKQVLLPIGGGDRAGSR